MKLFKKFIPVFVILVGVANVYAQDWPQYLGPDRNSTSTQKNILRTWSDSGPEVLWTADIGIGYGGTVVKDGKVYLLDRDDKVGDMLRCFDLKSGNELWSFSYESPGSVMFPGSRSIPTLDGNYIYTVGPFGHLYCIDINTHKPVWNKNLWADFGGGEVPRWAITQCPLVYGDLLIVASQAPQAGVVAYDKLTGDVKWETASLGNAGYVSPAIVKVSGEDHVVMITASQRGSRGTPGSGGKVIGINPKTGKILWEYTNWQCSIPVPSALDAGEGRMLIIGAYEAGSAMIQVKKIGDGNYEVSELFKTVEFGGHTKPPILVDGYFYAQYTTNERRDGLVCMSMDGEIMWKTKREPEFNKGSMILAEGLILATDGAKSLYLIEPDPTAFKPVASAEILAEGGTQDQRFGSQNWAPIALADGKLLIRDQSQLKCVKVAD
jgi:outer membrane protein assembly factor BamB